MDNIPAPLGDNDIYYIEMPRHLVEAVDFIVDAAKRLGCGHTITSDNDWKCVELVIKTWAILYPEHAKSLKSEIAGFKDADRDRGFTQKAEFQHQLELPPVLMQMIQGVFPQHKWTSKFVTQFLRRFPKFEVHQ